VAVLCFVQTLLFLLHRAGNQQALLETCNSGLRTCNRLS
jgi:hypothetical protein